jgi:hypothetical protein
MLQQNNLFQEKSNEKRKNNKNKSLMILRSKIRKKELVEKIINRRVHIE